MAFPKGGIKPPGSGRKKGTPNKIKSTAAIRAQMAELQAAALARTEDALGKQTPLEFALENMRDITNPPGFRLECAKLAAPYIHSKKADEPTDQVVQITEIRNIVVEPKDYTDEDRERARIGPPSGSVERIEPMVAPSVNDATSRLAKLRGIH
jgi:hypothetical protein